MYCGVRGVDGGDDHRIGLGLLQHRVELVEDGRGGPDDALCRPCAERIAIEEPDQLDPIGVIAHQVLAPHPGAARARAREREPLLPRRVRGLER